MSSVSADLLLLEVDALEGMVFDGVADLCWGLAEPGLLIGVEGFLGAGGALGAVVALKAATQAGVSEGAIATAITGELVEHAADFGGLLVDVHLPWVAETLAGEPGAAEDGRQGADLERSGSVISRDLVGRVGPLGVAGSGEKDGGKGQDPAAGF